MRGGYRSEGIRPGSSTARICNISASDSKFLEIVGVPRVDHSGVSSIASIRVWSERPHPIASTLTWVHRSLSAQTRSMTVARLHMLLGMCVTTLSGDASVCPMAPCRAETRARWAWGLSVPRTESHSRLWRL